MTADHLSISRAKKLSNISQLLVPRNPAKNQTSGQIVLKLFIVNPGAMNKLMNIQYQTATVAKL
jgi:hypothetical protein